MIESYKERLETLTESLQDNAGVDPLQDRYHSGYIAAIKDFLLISIEEVKPSGN